MSKNKKNIKDNNLPAYLFHQGTNYYAYRFMGAHIVIKDKVKGVEFTVWAPHAESVSVVGDFNGWNENINQMEKISDGGLFQTFIAGVEQFDNYKYAVKNNGKVVLKADPYAFHSETPPQTSSKVYSLKGYKWKDDEYVKNRTLPYDKPINIYEVNLSSWKRKENGDYYTYKELASELVSYVYDMGYTHVEFMPIAEHPFDGSWGYQVTGYYSITSRFGTPHDFMKLVDAFHRKGIGVIVDWVPAHFPKDLHGLYEFDGAPCYENQGWDRQEHKTWGTRIFDLGRNEVESFLISNANFMFEEFHIDGLRVDAVASMLYLDYDKKEGEWIPNEFGGKENLESIAFLKKLNTVVFQNYPYALMIAEESTAFASITKPVDVGGLGFNFKWNMGWMHDSLDYMACDPYFRSGCHDKLTFSMFYSFSENFVLPISHDEVVHGKKSLLDKMHGDVFDKFATIKTFMLYMFAHPGKKLSFMGNEFGQFKEWNYKEGLEFFLLKYQTHRKLKIFNKRLNNLYKANTPLYQIENSWDGFEWIAVEEKDNNVLSFRRKDKNGNQLIAILNFSGKDFDNYRLGLEEGVYKAVLCSDDVRYGGTGKLKRKTFKTAKKPAHGKEYSIRIKLPRLSGMYLIKTV